MGSDQVDFEKSRPTYPLYFDKNFEFNRDRRFYLLLLLSMWSAWWLKRRYYVEVDRARRTERMGNIENLPGYHFNNRGGVLIEKDFVGFEKYHKSGQAMDEWYKKAYPHQFSADAKNEPPAKMGHH